MEIDNDINTKVNKAFEALEEIKEVKVNANFKQNVFRKLEEETDDVAVVFNWFTPKLQLAVMVIVLLVNASAIVYSFSSLTEETNISGFAEAYNLTTTDTLIINQ